MTCLAVNYLCKFKKYGELEITDKGCILKVKNLSDKQKHSLFDLYYDSYYNTAQDTVTFATEFYNVVDQLRVDFIPLSLEYLETDEIYDEILEILGEK